ncbi:MAG: ABC transporter permease, partial [Phycisphaerae bacterium]
PMYRDFVNWLHRQINGSIRAWRVAEASLPGETVDWATAPVPISERPLFSRTAAGALVAGKANDHYINIAAGMGLAFLMFLVILIGAIPLTYSVLEEKMQRSAEVLLGSITPFQFMMGKILGMVGVSLSIMTIYIVLGFLAASAYGYGHTLPRHLIYWFVLYQAGSILMFGSLFAAIGAACNDMKDAQNLMAPASIIACIPLFVIRPVMMEPNSTFSTLVSFFPPATPVLMLLRQGLPAPVPFWQPVLGLILVLATALLCVALAARVFSVGILMQGKGANIREILQWAFYGIGHRPARPERRHDLAGSAP